MSRRNRRKCGFHGGTGLPCRSAGGATTPFHHELYHGETRNCDPLCGLKAPRLDHPAWTRGYVLLKYVPQAVYVAFDDHVPKKPKSPRESTGAAAGEDEGAEVSSDDEEPTPGTSFAEGLAPGVVAVAPTSVETEPLRLDHWKNLPGYILGSKD